MLEHPTTTKDPLEEYLDYYDYLYNIDPAEDEDTDSLPIVNNRVKQKEGGEDIDEDEDVNMEVNLILNVFVIVT